MRRGRRDAAARALLVAVVVGWLSAACGETSAVDPDATVVISGQVRAADGAPLVERPVRLASAPGGGDLAFAFLTLGLACATDICQEALRSTETDAGGRYRLELKGRDTQTSFGNVRQQAVSAAAAPRGAEVSGASTSARFVVQTERLELPPLQLVDPALSLTAAPGRVGVTWRTDVGGPYSLSFESGSVVPVWRVTTGDTAATLDARLLEGTSGRAVLSGTTSDQVVGSDVELTWRSPGLGYASAAGVPLSRGLACAYAAAPATPGAPSEQCPLTDGDLFSAQLPPAPCPSPPQGAPSAPTGCATATTATLRLPPAPRVELVVVRGCVESCAVEVSTDGQVFRRVATVARDFEAVRVPAEGVRAVRVGLGRDGLREVSVWGPASVEPGLQPIGGDAVERLRRPYAGTEWER